MLKRLVQHLKDRVSGKVPKGHKRSSQWPAARKAWLAKNPFCAVCGGNKKLEVHHIKPFHLHPQLELSESNFITLCEARKPLNCHLAFGHLLNFSSYNIDVTTWSAGYYSKLSNRP